MTQKSPNESDYDAPMSENDPARSENDPPPADPAAPNPEKDPSEWVTGEEPATGPQLSYLGTLAQQAGVEVPDQLTKAEASRLIDELRERTGRGADR
jgi:hypothetical protein